MTKLDRVALLQVLRAYVRYKGFRHRDLAKILDGDPTVLTCKSVPLDVDSWHRMPDWERILIWTRQLGLEVRFEVTSVTENYVIGDLTQSDPRLPMVHYTGASER